MESDALVQEIVRGIPEALLEALRSVPPVLGLTTAALLALIIALRIFELRRTRKPRPTRRGPDSRLEWEMLALLERAGLPKPYLQYEVPARGRRYRVDLAYPDLKLAIELDGRYHRDPERVRYDQERDRALSRLGWATLRFTWNDVTRREREVIRTLEARGLREVLSAR